MAAGDRKVKILSLTIHRVSPVMAFATWSLQIENKVGVDVQVLSGKVQWSLGTPAVARAKTLLQIENEAITQVTVSEDTPANDGIS